ncbi:MAG: hypothetical protein HY796_00385 [Elusimicrobia bacterium]|nr:hypothetical protein [Elusimicrobiota bacterium]
MKKAIPIVIMSALLFVVCSICEASIMSRLCSSFANVLDDEETKTAAALKNCKKNCAIIQKKLDLIKAAQKKVDDSCAKGITPDITKVSAGLDKNVQAKLRKQYNQHSKMYDGKADLPDKDFGLTTKSNQSPGLTVGKGGQVADLKTSEPVIPKLNSATEFSLSGTKLSGKTPGQAPTKQSPILLASASSAKTPVDAPITSAKTTLSPQKAQGAATALLKCTESATLCMSVVPGKPCSCPTANLCDAGPGVAGMCMSAKYCAGEGCPGQQECSAGKVTIDGPKDLLLSKPSTKSKEVPYKVITTGKAPTKIKWSVSNEKVKITSWWPDNNLSVKVIPVSESGPAKGDVTITATVDNCLPASLPLTVRRPATIEHGPLTYSRFKKGKFLKLIPNPIPFGGTKDGFLWTLKDQFSEPLKDVEVSEAVWCDPKDNTLNLCFKAYPPLGHSNPWNYQTTTKDGQITDTYAIPLILLPSSYTFIVRQGITANGYKGIRVPGYKGTSILTFTESSVSGTSPVILK